MSVTAYLFGVSVGHGVPGGSWQRGEMSLTFDVGLVGITLFTAEADMSCAHEQSRD